MTESSQAEKVTPMPLKQEETLASAEASPKKYVASIYQGPGALLPLEFAAGIRALERALGKPVWMLVHQGQGTYGTLDETVLEGFLEVRADLRSSEPVALLIDSPGGDARAAYLIAKLFRRQCGGFVAIIPRYAKSAATLLTLGAQAILLGPQGELGPLDAQYFDPNQEDVCSALDEVHALQRLNAASLEAVDQAMMLLAARSGKKVETLLPSVLSYVAQMMRPLLEKIDTVHYSKTSRLLKVAEEYAIRLLEAKYGRGKASRMARRLVENYPEHGFVIDADEATTFGLDTMPVEPNVVAILDQLLPHLSRLTALGRVEEAPEP